MVDINLVEFLWVVLNTVTLVFTLTALFDARADREAVRLLNGKARELAASGIVRREAIRCVLQVLLLSIAVPGLFSDRETAVTPVLVVLMTVPVVLLVSSFLDARERKAMTLLVSAEVLARVDVLTRIEEKLDHNTEVSTEAASKADRAYTEANHLNERMAAQDAQILSQGEDAAVATERIEGTIDATASQVADLHEGSAPRGAA